MKTADQINFAVHNIYVKDVSFEAPNSPMVFAFEWKPKLNFDIEVGRVKLEDNLFEVVIAVTVQVLVDQQENKQLHDSVAFLVEVKQAGIFSVEGITDDAQIEHILSTSAPAVLFPYARQLISGLVTHGSFPQLIIPPMNFDALYKKHLSEQTQTTAAQETIA
jgi:preprotein translocase subunit SecB